MRTRVERLLERALKRTLTRSISLCLSHSHLSIHFSNYLALYAICLALFRRHRRRRYISDFECMFRMRSKRVVCERHLAIQYTPRTVVRRCMVLQT